MPRELSRSMFWRVCLINGFVFAVGIVVLVLSPATVSADPRWSEVLVLAIGLAIIVVLNGFLLRMLLRPLDRLSALMGDIDLRRPGQRLTDVEHGPTRDLVEGFNEMLDRLEDERSTTSTLALQAQEAERQRLAQELHDEVGQSLTAVLLSLKQVTKHAPADLVAELEMARDTTRTSLEEVRRISQALRPGVLDDLGLLNSLSSLASDLSARSEIRVQRRFLPGLPTLSSDAELVVYRVAQEAFTNVARHARATEVELSLARRGDRIELRVADNGVGFGGREGAGIQGMRERAATVGGQLSIRVLAPGTEVVLEVPL